MSTFCTGSSTSSIFPLISVMAGQTRALELHSSASEFTVLTVFKAVGGDDLSSLVDNV